ncbi:MAG: hypothetical protein JSR39_10840, partial [Verrucomicrobia bacterium]|nr:hypothetical protein [Verrucomicrobiota bacterium]
MSLQINAVQPIVMQGGEEDLNCQTAISSPWNYEGDTLKKIVAWAGFFFVGWAYHPICAIVNCFTQVCEWAAVHLKIRNAASEILFTDPISQTLFSFNNTRVGGQVNGIYITTNESRLEAARQLFVQHPRAHREMQTIHIGCATWHNLDIICARRSTYGLIVDFNPKNAEFMRKTIELVKACESREA